MKNQGYNKMSYGKRFLFSKLFANIYYFCSLHIYLLLTVLGAALSIGVLLFVAEIVFPNAVHIFNYSMTDKVFAELVAEKRYHAAVAFMETKEGLIAGSDESYRYRQELADCYVQTGDYPKALEQYRILRKEIESQVKTQQHGKHPLTQEEVAFIKDMTEACFLKDEFKIYVKMGDIPNVRKYSELLRGKTQNTDWSKMREIFGDKGEKLEGTLNGREFTDGFKLELMQGLYLQMPDSAINELERYAIKVGNSPKHNPIYKLRVTNELIRMLIEQNRTIEARHYLEIALQLVDGLEYNQIIYSQLGELSEHCRSLNDLETGRRLLDKYLYWIDDTYEKGDINYALAHAMEFPYLAKNNEWSELTKRLSESTKTLREQITSNFAGMTSSQREYFISQFMPILQYANNALEAHPSEALAKVVFENNMFMRGLLMRSTTGLANTIAAMNDSTLSKQYDRYISLKQELVARQYVSGLGNSLKKNRIEKELGGLETEIADKCRDFRRKNESDITIAAIKSSLAKKEVAMIFIEGDRYYHALALDNTGKVQHTLIGDKGKIDKQLSQRSSLYTSEQQILPHTLVNEIIGKTVYYANAGAFNRIALDALPIDRSGKTLGDIAQFRLVGSPSDIPTVKNYQVSDALRNRHIALWGGVEYETGKHPEIPDLDRAVMRGDSLRFLHGSLDEVQTIANLLRQNGNSSLVFTGSNATEKSLLNRSRKHDYILHISTHGFFHDDGAFTNPMQNAGLLFANSQSYWTNESLASNINESDGILRADEIAALDLSGCRLVVLSACQTGLGESNSEGVYGLQRAFKLAGVESVLMSLWSVDDNATKELMTEFYSQLIKGLSPADALKSAKNTMRRQGYSPDKWAAFVLLN